MIQSFFIEKLNKFAEFTQNLFEKITGGSAIVKNINDCIFALLVILLCVSTFCSTSTMGILAIGIIVLGIIKFLFKQGEKIIITKPDVALIVFFGILTIATINSTLPHAALEGYLKYVIYVGFYFAILSLFQEKKKKVLKTILLISVLSTLEACYSLFTANTALEGATWQDLSYINPEDAINRIYGSLKPFNPNLLAGYLIATLPCVIGVNFLTLEKRHKKSFLIALASLLLIIFAIFQTGCRGAYLALVALFLSILLISYRIVYYDFSAFQKIKKWWTIFVGAIASCTILALTFMPKVLNRLFSVFLLRVDSSTSFRMNVYKSSWHMFCDNPILGIGPGNQTFREIYGYYMLTGYDALGAYSVPLELAVETGIFGLLAFAAFIGLLFYEFIKYITQDQSIRGKIYVSVGILTVIGIMAHGLFDTIFFRPQVQFIFWTIIAIFNSVVLRKEPIKPNRLKGTV